MGHIDIFGSFRVALLLIWVNVGFERESSYRFFALVESLRREKMMMMKTKIEMTKPKERFQGQWNHRTCPLMRLSHVTKSSKKGSDMNWTGPSQIG